MSKSKSYMQMIFIDSDGDARQTNVGAAMSSSAKTRQAFNSLRRFGVDIEEAEFLCDYYDAQGDLVDTIAIHRRDFTTITGEPVKTDAEYRQIDEEYWRQVRERRSAAS